MRPKSNREKMIQIMFETVSIPSFYVGVQPMLAIYISSRTSGIVLESDERVTDTVVIYEGDLVPSRTVKWNLARSDVNSWLQKLRCERGYNFTTFQHREVVRDIKQRLAYVALDFDAEMQRAATTSEINRTYTLCDGNDIVI
jgi:actin